MRRIRGGNARFRFWFRTDQRTPHGISSAVELQRDHLRNCPQDIVDDGGGAAEQQYPIHRRHWSETMTSLILARGEGRRGHAPWRAPNVISSALQGSSAGTDLKLEH